MYEIPALLHTVPHGITFNTYIPLH